MVKTVYRKLKHIHLIGIGGTGMNGIAEVLHNLGYRVSGSDLSDGEATRRLRELGATVSIGHKSENIHGADVVVVSSAVREDNVEVREARRLKIPVIPRAEMLAELMRMRYGIAVAGSHGKTSTTSMVATVLDKAGFDPTIIVGGRLNTVGAHARLGEGDFFVAEADESDRSFLMLSPFIAVLTNIDAEHLDQYKGVDDIKKAFVLFANKVPFYCPVILCLDDANLQSIIPQLERRIITYGLSAQADFNAQDIRFEAFSSVSTLFHKGREIGTLRLSVPGPHMVLNALAAVAVGSDLDIPSDVTLGALAAYAGAGRRFELKADIRDVMVVEDYGHHPTEIRATLNGAKLGWPRRRLVAVFQPHRYTRLAHLKDEFATAFNQADAVVLTEVYPAGEDPIPGVTGRALYEEIVRFGHKDVRFAPDFHDIPARLMEIVRPGDIVIVLGAGNINKIIPDFIRLLEKNK
jgi:UDP-N-acetylmuramate--alanine ligase